MNAGPDRLRPQRLGGREGRHEEPALQRGVVQLRRHRPGDAHHAGTAQVLGNRVAADADHGRDLVAALATDVLETKNLSNLTHRQSLAWHGGPRCHSGTTLPWVDDCSRTAPPAPTQGRLECLGMGGWLASESPAGIRRNARLASVGIRTLVAELGDITRFANPRQLMAYLWAGSVRPFQRRNPATGWDHQGWERLGPAPIADARRPGATGPGPDEPRATAASETFAKPIRDTAWKAQERLCASAELARREKRPTSSPPPVPADSQAFVWAIARQAQPAAA